MESAPSPADDHTNPGPEESASRSWTAADQFRDRFDTLLPELKGVGRVTAQTLEATRGSLDEAVRVISLQSGRAAHLVQSQLEELLHSFGDGSKGFGDSLEPLERQLEQLLDDLNETLRPRIEQPVRQRPLLALAIAAGVGVVIGSLLSSGRRS